jgi:hypothetical protein
MTSCLLIDGTTRHLSSCGTLLLKHFFAGRMEKLFREDQLNLPRSELKPVDPSKCKKEQESVEGSEYIHIPAVGMLLEH